MSQKSTLIAVFVIVFFGYVGFTLPIPILPEMFLDPSSPLLKASVSQAERALLLGILIATYPLGQFFGNPILGLFADRLGRRKILIGSLFVTFLGYLLTAYSVYLWDLTLLFMGRFICGFAEGNITIAQSAMADISDSSNKIKNFSLINVAASLGFVVGPLLGGKLSDPEIVSWFNEATPFWCASVLTLITIGYSYWQFKETVVQKSCPIERSVFQSLGHILKIPPLGYFLFLSFLFSLGLTLFLSMYPVFFVQKYHVSASHLSEIIAYTALPFIFAQMFVLKPLHNWLSLEKSTVLAALLMGVFLLLFPMPRSILESIFLIFPVGVLNLIVFVNGSVLISNHAPKEEQGNVLGINQSLYVLAMALAGFIGGALAGVSPSLPFIAAGLILIFGGLLLFIYIKRQASLK